MPSPPACGRAKISQSVKEPALRAILNPAALLPGMVIPKSIVEDADKQPPESVIKTVTGTDNLKLNDLM